MSELLCDRELLELAAKAAGYKLESCTCRKEVFRSVTYKPYSTHWFPLDDDGDAFRLAVMLKMDITVMKNTAMYTHNELCAATRRAIVTAAAEIGRAGT